MIKLLKPEDIAEAIHVEYRTAIKYIQQEMTYINTSPPGKRPRYLVKESDFEKWLERHTVQPVKTETRKACTADLKKRGLLDENGRISTKKPNLAV